MAGLYEEDGSVNRQDIEAAIATSVELRALHSALIQPNTPHLKLLTSASSPPPLPRLASHFSAHDYPVFTPSYVDEPLPAYAHPQTVIGGSWEGNQIDIDDKNLQLVEYTRQNASSRMAGLVNIDTHIYPEDDTKSVSSSCTYHKSLTDSRAALNPKSRGMILSWLLPRLKRKQKNGNSSHTRTESEQVSQVHKDFGTVSIETLKKELIDANQERDLALTQVSEMRSSFEELRKKLETLESYCEKLKKALRYAAQTNTISKEQEFLPASEEVMIEGFLQIVSEARFSVKQFCKVLIEQIDETDEQLTENSNVLFKPYKLSLTSKYSKVVLYHLEAVVNKAFYQDFENCMFQQNGTPKLLDPQQQREAQYKSFSALRNLSWNEVLKKGARYYSEEFSQFCEQKMKYIITTLNWTRSWSETLLESFFVAAKCIWLLHLLAFSFNPPLMILRVDEDRSFDAHYMEDVFSDKQKSQNPSRVKVLIMPGFYVQDKILKCKVLCRYKSVA